MATHRPAVLISPPQQLSNVGSNSQPPVTKLLVRRTSEIDKLARTIQSKRPPDRRPLIETIDALSSGNGQVAIEPDLERSPFIEHQLMASFNCGQRTVGRSLTRSGSSAAFSSVVRSGGRAFSGTYDDGFGDLFLRHPFASNFSLLPDLTQAVLARNSSDGGDQRPPAVAGIDFIEAQQQPRVQTGFDGAHMSFDLAPGLDGAAIGGGHRLSQPGL